MAMHHSNRVRDHFSPLLQTEQGFSFTSKKRKAKLSGSTIGVFFLIVMCLNEKTNSWPVSYKYMRDKTQASKQTIARSIAQLVDHGFLIKEPSSYRANIYRLGPAVACPADCESMASHNTASELQQLNLKNPEGLADPDQDQTRSNSEDALSLISKTKVGPLDGADKETKRNKKKVSCVDCFEGFEMIAGTQRRMHADTCPRFLVLQQRPAWVIAQDNYGSGWEQLSELDQQRFFWSDYGAMEERKDQEAKTKHREQQEKDQALFRLTTGKGILPNWMTFLHTRYEMAPHSINQFIGSAEKFSDQGIDIKDGSEILITGLDFDYCHLNLPEDSPLLVRGQE